MPFPKNIEQKLGFTQIRELIQANCLSEMGKIYLDKMRFSNRFDLIEKWLLQTQEFKVILTEDADFPSDHFFDVGNCLYKARIEGVWLLEEELHQLKLVLTTFLGVARFFRDRPGKYLELESLLSGLIINDLIIRRIDRVIDLEGNLRPNASIELSKISQKIQEKETEIRKRIQKLFDKNTDLGYLTDQLGITIRDGRLVLPVLAEHKRHVPGFVHDESNTGQTVYIEPTDCFDLNNSLRELQIAYRRERERVLLELTDQIRPELPEIEQNLQRLGLFDFIRAKGKLAVTLKSNMPILSKHPGLKLENAYHPLLRLSHDQAGNATIPLSIQLTKDKFIIVISGPNAGGKSVCLKTVGLLQYMLQSGLLIPCESHSEIGIYKDVMVDIGDEQSIENDLSTYSSHLLSMKNFCDFADGKTLFLIDEFGTGTDPLFGGPLAEGILHHLAQKRAHGIVTTHFSNLKNFASQQTGLENASMLFDHDAMKPLYLLEVGKPGSSYAFELAGKSGLSQHIINYAKNKIGDKQRKADELLIELEKEKTRLKELTKRFTEKDLSAQALQQKYEKLLEDLEQSKKTLIKKAKQEALALVSEANIKIEATIREIKEKQADSEVQRKARTYIKSELTALKDQAKDDLLEEIELVSNANDLVNTYKIGDYVRVEGQDAIAQILEIQKTKVLVSLGELRSQVSIKKISSVLPVAAKSEIKVAVKGLDMNTKMQQFNGELNIIGKRGEEALRMLTEFLDESYLLGAKQVRIVHGKGYGILRKLVRESLRKTQMVDSFADERIELGGDGVTIVNLKMG